MTGIAEYAATSAVSTSTNSTTPNTDQLTADVPTIETPAYARSKPRWDKVRDVYRGTEAIRGGREDYLPMFPGESDAHYEVRRTIAGFFNGYARTLEASVGLLMDPPPTLNADMPPSMAKMWENVDLEGTHGIVFCFKLLLSSIGDGIAGIFTDYPRLDDPTLDTSRLTLAGQQAIRDKKPLAADDQARLGLRPYFVLCKADEILPIYERVGGTKQVVMFIRRQFSKRRKGRFGFEPICYYHVHELRGGKVYYERWSGADATNVTRDVEPTLVNNLTGIPWSPLPCGPELGENEYKPTLEDLADLNITHHRVETGILSLEEEAFVPTLTLVGRLPDPKTGEYPPVYTGPDHTIEIPGDVGVNVPAFYVSPPVDVIEPAMKTLENLKAEMGANGASFLAPEPRAQETATAHEMDATAERASLGTISHRFKDCLEAAFGWACQYTKEKGGSITVNKDFRGRGVSNEDVNKWSAALQNGGISLREYRYAISTGQLPETFDPENVQDVLTSGFASKSDNTQGDQGGGDGGGT